MRFFKSPASKVTQPAPSAEADPESGIRRGSGGDSAANSPGSWESRTRRRVLRYGGDQPKVTSFLGNQPSDEYRAEVASPTGNRHSRELTGSPPSRESSRGSGVSAIETKLTSWREYDRIHLLTEEVGISRKESEQYLRDSLRFAKETLEATYHALTQEARRGRPSLNAAQVRETIRALGTKESWNQLLQSHNIANTEATQRAVNDLVACIARLDTDDVSVESAKALLSDVEFLRREVSQALHASKDMLPRAYARELITTSRQVATEVMIGLTAASATAEFSGAPLVPEVVYTALGIAVASSLKELYRNTTAKLLNTYGSTKTRLREYHQRLIIAIRDLESFIPWLARSNPALPDALETVRSVHLATVFLVGYVDQLAVAVVWPGRDRYRGILQSIRSLLDKVGHLAAREDMRSIDEILLDLDRFRNLLEGFSEAINSLA
jgi:hypothetical protein